jgi:hypothetical protein
MNCVPFNVWEDHAGRNADWAAVSDPVVGRRRGEVTRGFSLVLEAVCTHGVREARCPFRGVSRNEDFATSSERNTK